MFLRTATAAQLCSASSVDAGLPPDFESRAGSDGPAGTPRVPRAPVRKIETRPERGKPEGRPEAPGMCVLVRRRLGISWKVDWKPRQSRESRKSRKSTSGGGEPPKVETGEAPVGVGARARVRACVRACVRARACTSGALMTWRSGSPTTHLPTSRATPRARARARSRRARPGPFRVLFFKFFRVGSDCESLRTLRIPLGSPTAAGP